MQTYHPKTRLSPELQQFVKEEGRHPTRKQKTPFNTLPTGLFWVLTHSACGGVEFDRGRAVGGAPYFKFLRGKSYLTVNQLVLEIVGPI